MTLYERHRQMQKFNGTRISAFMLWCEEQREEAEHMALVEGERAKAPGGNWDEANQRLEAALEVLRELASVERALAAFRGVLLAESDVPHSGSGAYPAHPNERGKQPPHASI